MVWCVCGVVVGGVCLCRQVWQCYNIVRVVCAMGDAAKSLCLLSQRLISLPNALVGNR